jgi:hypothetical protein
MKTLQFIVGSLLCLNAWAQDKPQAQLFDPPTLIPIDPATLGYTVNNRELRFKEHVALPGNISLRGGGMIDARYRLSNLIADERGTYEQDKIKKIVIVDTRTGEVRPTPYVGDIRCFVDGNLATLIDRGKREDATFAFGKYGEVLQTWKGVVEPEGTYLNLMSCSLQSFEKLKIEPPPGMRAGGVVLRAEHGQLVTLEGQPLAGNTPDSPEVQRLMQQPFMQNMTLPAHSERWILKKPNGEAIPIPNNPGEAIVFRSVTYLPYMDAYFIESRSRPFLPKDMWGIPRFARVLYPDGRVVRYGVPDVIRQPSMRGEIGYTGLYTKAGLVWRIQHARIDRTGRTNYKGKLREGYYLDRRDTKTLVKIPDLSATSQEGLLAPIGVSSDGCTVGTRREVAQKHPHILLNIHYINLCTGE